MAMGPEDKLTAAKRHEMKTKIDKLPSQLPQQMSFREVMMEAVDMKQCLALAYLKRNLGPSVLVNDGVSHYLGFYLVLESVLAAFDVKIKEPENKFPVEAMMELLYVDQASWYLEAQELWKSFKEGSARGQMPIQTINAAPSAQPTVDSPRARNNSGAGVRISNTRSRTAVASTFKQDKDRFDGSIGSKTSLFRMRRIYTTAMDEYDIQRDDQVSLLHHGLCGQAKDFYFDHIQGRVTQLGEAFALLTNRFDTEHKRAQAIAFLDAQSLSSIRDEFNCSTAVALDKAFNRISDVIPQCGPEMSADVHRGHYLASIRSILC